MKNRTNQIGLSLVEVLATIVILGIVMSITSTILFSGLSFSKKAENQALIQQEANYIMAVLKKTHENEDPYEISVDGKITITNSTTGVETTIGKDSFKYVIEDTENNLSTVNTTIEIDPNTVKTFHVRIYIESRKDSKTSYEITTILSRM